MSNIYFVTHRVSSFESKVEINTNTEYNAYFTDKTRYILIRVYRLFFNQLLRMKLFLHRATRNYKNANKTCSCRTRPNNNVFHEDIVKFFLFQYYWGILWFALRIKLFLHRTTRMNNKNTNKPCFCHRRSNNIFHDDINVNLFQLL